MVGKTKNPMFPHGECKKIPHTEVCGHRNILITGATGFIGRHLVKRLSELKKHTLFCITRNPNKAGLLKSFGVKIIYADIGDVISLDKIANYKVDIIFHCAGFVENKNPKELHRVNVLGTENICKLAIKLKAKRLIYLSSVAVISANNVVPLRDDLPYGATNIYGESKIEAEKKVLEYRDKGLSVVIIRPPMIYGEDEPHMLKLLLKLMRYRLLPLINNGKSKFHLVYIENVIDLLIFSLDKDEFLKGTFMVADKEVLTTKEAFTIFSQAIGAKVPFNIPAWLNSLLLNLPFLGKRLRFFIKDRAYSIERIEGLGFKPRHMAKEALRRSAKNLFQTRIGTGRIPTKTAIS